MQTWRRGDVALLDAPLTPLQRVLRASPWLAPVLFAVSGLLLLPRYRYIHLTDEISYITIAERYARGDILHAVNAYWAPMVSWLLAILVFLHIPVLLAAKLLSLLIGVGAVLAVRRLACHIDMSDDIRDLLTYLSVPVILSYSLGAFAADILQAALVVLYLSVVIDPAYVQRRSSGVLAGLLGASLYFSKTYGFLFFAIHFLLISLLYLRLAQSGPPRRRVAKHLASGFAVFLGLSLAWGGLLAHKYGNFTFGVGPTYNHSIVNPNSSGQAIYDIGFTGTHFAAETSIWEEPYYFAGRAKSWSPFESVSSAWYQTKLILRNGVSTIRSVQTVSVFMILLIPAGIVILMRAAVRARRQDGPQLSMALAFGSIAVYAAGYTIVYSEERYLRGILLALLVVSGHVLTASLRHPLLGSRVRTGIVMTAFSVSVLIHPIRQLRSTAYQGRPVDAISTQLRHSEVAGADFGSSNDFGASNVVAYQIGARYWGVPRRGASESAVVEELRSKGIRFYFVWNGSELTDPGLAEYRRLRSGSRRLVIYSVRGS